MKGTLPLLLILTIGCAGYPSEEMSQSEAKLLQDDADIESQNPDVRVRNIDDLPAAENSSDHFTQFCDEIPDYRWSCNTETPQGQRNQAPSRRTQ